MQQSNLAINVLHLYKSFKGKPAVIDLNLDVKYGEIFGFLGPNGAGKTTTLRMLCGLLTPDAGEGTCLGYDIVKDSKAIKQHVGYIPQFFGLYNNLTVAENLAFIAEVYGMVNRANKIKNILEQFNLTPYADRLAGNLSGGYKQRLSLAAALLHEPFLLLLDEPTASVDPSSRRDFWEIMHMLSAEGLTILLSSHNIEEMERCNRVAYISEGRLLVKGEIKTFVENINLHTFRVRGSRLLLLAKQLEVTPGIDQVITFNEEIHVCGLDLERLETAIQLYRGNPNYEWQKTDSSLEDVFVLLSKNPNIMKQV